jgi:hypothetical protein
MTAILRRSETGCEYHRADKGQPREWSRSRRTAKVGGGADDPSRCTTAADQPLPPLNDLWILLSGRAESIYAPFGGLRSRLRLSALRIMMLRDASRRDALNGGA